MDGDPQDWDCLHHSRLQMRELVTCQKKSLMKLVRRDEREQRATIAELGKPKRCEQRPMIRS